MSSSNRWWATVACRTAKPPNWRLDYPTRGLGIDLDGQESAPFPRTARSAATTTLFRNVIDYDRLLTVGLVGLVGVIRVEGPVVQQLSRCHVVPGPHRLVEADDVLRRLLGRIGRLGVESLPRKSGRQMLASRVRSTVQSRRGVRRSRRWPAGPARSPGGTGGARAGTRAPGWATRGPKSVSLVTKSRWVLTNLSYRPRRLSSSRAPIKFLFSVAVSVAWFLRMKQASSFLIDG